MSDLMGRGLRSAFTQAGSAPGTGVAVTVPASVALYRTVYGSVSLDASTSDSVTVDVETGIGTGLYETVQFLSIGSTDEVANMPYAFQVGPGRRYKFTLTGAGAAIVYYSYVDV